MQITHMPVLYDLRYAKDHIYVIYGEKLDMGLRVQFMTDLDELMSLCLAAGIKLTVEATCK